MTRKIILIVIVLILEAALGYYSLIVNGSLFSKFLFFVLSAGIISFLVVTCIGAVLPSEEDYDSTSDQE